MTLDMLTKPLKQSINKICSCLITNSEACVAKALVMVKCTFAIENDGETTYFPPGHKKECF